MPSRSRTLHIGITGNLYKRLFQLRSKEHDRFTARFNCDRLTCFERYRDVGIAIAGEKQLKGRLRSQKIARIESANHGGVDLSREWYERAPVDYRRDLDRMNT